VVAVALRGGVNWVVTLLVARLLDCAVRVGLSAASLGGLGVLDYRCFLAVQVFLAVGTQHVVAVQGACGARGGERFGSLAFLLGQVTGCARAHRGPGIRGGGVQAGIGVGEGGVDVWAAPADGFACGDPVDCAGGVELLGPRRCERRAVVPSGVCAAVVDLPRPADLVEGPPHEGVRAACGRSPTLLPRRPARSGSPLGQ